MSGEDNHRSEEKEYVADKPAAKMSLKERLSEMKERVATGNSGKSALQKGKEEML